MSISLVKAEETCHWEDVGDGSLQSKPFSKLIKYFYQNTPVISKELTEDGQAWKLNCKLTTFNADEDLTDDEYVSNMSDWVNYISAYDEGYIGTEETYNMLREKGIVLFQKKNKNDNTCSIGYSPSENKWYGWSHRAIYGFTIGDEVKEGDITNTSGLVEEYRIQHPDEDLSLPVGFKAETLQDARRMAIAFASAIS